MFLLHLLNVACNIRKIFRLIKQLNSEKITIDMKSVHYFILLKT